MKHLSKLALLTLLAAPMMIGCGQKGNKYVRPLVDNSVYDVAIPSRESPITDVKILNVPKTSFEVGYMSYMGIKMEIKYADEVVTTIPFTEKLFPVDQLENLKTPGKKTIDFLFKGNHIYFDITLMKAEVPVYHKVTFRDHNNLVLQETLFSYLEPAVYTGRTIDSYIEGDYYYEFADEWDHDTRYVYNDFITNAVYNATDVRDYGRKHTERLNLRHEEGTYAYNVFHLMSSLNSQTYSPTFLYYMGEVRDVEIAHSDAIYHNENDFDAVEMNITSVDELDFNAPMMKMTENVYNLGDKEETAKYPISKMADGHNLALDMTVENGKAKGLGDGNFKQMGYTGNFNFMRNDGRVVSHESILNEEVKSDVYSEMDKQVSIPLYVGAHQSGYYRVSYIARIDLFLEVTFDVLPQSGIFKVTEAILYPCFVYEKVRTLLSYSPSGEFTETHKQTIDFDIDDLRAYFAK